MDRGEDHSDQPIGVLAIVCRVTPALFVPLVRSRRRQLMKTIKPERVRSALAKQLWQLRDVHRNPLRFVSYTGLDGLP